MAKKRRRSLIDKPKVHRTPAPAPSRRPTIPPDEADNADPTHQWSEALEAATGDSANPAAPDEFADLPEKPDPTDAPPIPETLQGKEGSVDQIPGVTDAEEFDLFGSAPDEEEAAALLADSPPVLGLPEASAPEDESSPEDAPAETDSSVRGEDAIPTVDDDLPSELARPDVDDEATVIHQPTDEEIAAIAAADPDAAEAALAEILSSSGADAPEASEEAVLERPSTLIPDDDVNPVVIRNLPADFEDADESLGANTDELAFFDSGDDLGEDEDDRAAAVVSAQPTPGQYNRQTLVATASAIGFVTLAVLVFMGVMSSMREPLSSETPAQVAPVPEPPPKPEPPPPPPEPEVAEEELVEEEVVEEEVAEAPAPRPQPRPQPKPDPEPVAAAPEPAPEPVVEPAPAPTPEDDKKGILGIFGKKKKNK